MPGSATISDTINLSKPASRPNPMDGETDMLTSNNVSQLRYLLKLTRFDVLTWKRTADRNETFTTSSCEATFVATVWEDSLRRYFQTIEPRWKGSNLGIQCRHRPAGYTVRRGQK